jgi:hypothetical protein
MLNLRPLMSCFIRESLASEAFNRDAGPLRIVNAELRAGVHAEVEFRQIAIKVLLVHVLVHADQTALEDRKEAFKGIGMHIATCPFVLGMVNRFVLVGLELVNGRAVSHQTAAVVEVLNQMVADVLVIEVHAANVAAALDQREDDFATLGVQGAVIASLRGARQESLVCLNGHVRTAQRAAIGRRRHCVADSVTHEPCGFHAAAQHPLKLAGADAFLGRAHKVDRLKPMGHRRVAVLEDRPDLDRELLAALIALAETGPRGLASKLADARRVGVAAMWADRAVRPQPSLNVGVGGLFVFEVRGVEIRVHDLGSGIAKSCAWERGLSSVTSPVDGLSAGRWLASEDRQLSVESALVGGPRFAAGDIGREVRILFQYSRSAQPAQHRHHQ